MAPLAVSFVLFGDVGWVFLFRRPGAGLRRRATVERAGWAWPDGPWALPVAVAAFAILAFVGVPQFVLIAAAVVAATSAWTGFLQLDRHHGLGPGRVLSWPHRRRAAFSCCRARGVQRFMDLVGRNGFL